MLARGDTNICSSVTRCKRFENHCYRLLIVFSDYSPKTLFTTSENRSSALTQDVLELKIIYSIVFEVCSSSYLQTLSQNDHLYELLVLLMSFC